MKVLKRLLKKQIKKWLSVRRRSIQNIKIFVGGLLFKNISFIKINFKIIKFIYSSNYI